jgi:hypothetical protein
MLARFRCLAGQSHPQDRAARGDCSFDEPRRSAMNTLIASEAGAHEKGHEPVAVAADNGDLQAVGELRADDVFLRGDGGGRVPTLTRPVHGRVEFARVPLSGDAGRSVDRSMARCTSTPNPAPWFPTPLASCSQSRCMTAPPTATSWLCARRQSGQGARPRSGTDWWAGDIEYGHRSAPPVTGRPRSLGSVRSVV